jgi:hypothetical protein
MSGVSTTPTLAGFLSFVRNQMGIPVDALPDDSIWLVYAYNAATEVANMAVECVAPTVYMLMIYNLAADNLMNWAQDNPDATDPADQTYFSTYRSKTGLGAFVPGFIQSTSDVSTSESLMIPDFFKDLTLSNLQNLKTPWGRAYLALAQSWGTVWGLT